ncbi:hypothetical protein ACTFIZ_011826 [Dictyostelium cf. discoideum]
MSNVNYLAASCGFFTSKANNKEYSGYALFYINGEEVSFDDSRGLNVIEIDPNTNRVISSKSYDFFGDNALSFNDLALYFGNNSSIFLVAVKDSSNSDKLRFPQNFKPHNIGFRESYSFIGNLNKLDQYSTSHNAISNGTATSSLTLIKSTIPNFDLLTKIKSKLSSIYSILNTNDKYDINIGLEELNNLINQYIDKESEKIYNIAELIKQLNRQEKNIYDNYNDNSLPELKQVYKKLSNANLEINLAIHNKNNSLKIKSAFSQTKHEDEDRLSIIKNLINVVDNYFKISLQSLQSQRIRTSALAIGVSLSSILGLTFQGINTYLPTM